MYRWESYTGQNRNSSHFISEMKNVVIQGKVIIPCEKAVEFKRILYYNRNGSVIL